MKQKKIPLRKCISCHEMIGKKSLLRVVRTPEGDVQIDSTGKKPGRGAYLCDKEHCFRILRKNRALERALHVSITNELYDRLEIEWRKEQTNE